MSQSKLKFAVNSVVETVEKLETSKLPKWMDALKPFFKFVSSEKGKGKEPRVIYTMECQICVRELVKKRGGQVITVDEGGDLTEGEAGEQKGAELAVNDVNVSGTKSTFRDRQAKGFLSHLKRNHEEEHIKYEEKMKKMEKAQSRMQHFAVGTIVRRTKQNESYDKNDPQQVKFEEALVDFVILDSMPFSMCEGRGFNLLVEAMDPKLSVPSARSMGRRMDVKYDMVWKEVKQQIGKLDAGRLHLIIDIWTSKQNYSVMGVTAQYVWNWELVKAVVGFKHFPETHSGENIRRVLDAIIKDTLEICQTKIGTVTADNASNMCKAFIMDGVDVELDNAITDFIHEDNAEGEDVVDDGMEEAEEVSLMTSLRRNPCLAHLLQLAIKDAWNQSIIVTKLAKQLTDIVSYFNRSPHQYTKLKDLTGGYCLVKPCVTRWNALFHGFTRVLDNNKMGKKDIVANSINAILEEAKSEKKKTGPKKVTMTSSKKMQESDGGEEKKDTKIPANFSDADIRNLQIVTRLLDPLAELTDKLQADKVTSSIVIPGLIYAVLELEDVKLESDHDLVDFKTNLIKSVLERFATESGTLYREVPIKNKKKPEDVDTNDGAELDGDAVTKKKKSTRRVKLYSTDAFRDTKYVLATLLDPRIREAPFEDAFVTNESQLAAKLPTLEFVKGILEVELKMTADMEKDDSTDNLSSEEEPPVPPSPKKKRNSIFSMVEARRCKKGAGERMDEGDKYLTLPLENAETNPLQFWKCQSEKLPKLSQLSLKYLSMPASSGAVERLFSVAGAIGRSRRACIRISTMEKTLCVRQYLMNKAKNVE